MRAVLLPDGGRSSGAAGLRRSQVRLLSADPQQQLLFVADGQNQRVTVLGRESLEVLAQIGTGGRYPGQFYSVAAVGVDSRGNLYTGEGLEGKRLQKWNVKR